jgi:glutathione-independent formaldehyde dehydrogenase
LKSAYAYGYADMGPYQGGQAEYLRVPAPAFPGLVVRQNPVKPRSQFLQKPQLMLNGAAAALMADAADAARG